MFRLAKQSLAIAFSFAFAFTALNTELVSYLPWILGFVIVFFIIYIILKRKRKKGAEILTGSPFETISLTIGVLLIIFITGGLNSGTFFLLYFLLFGAAFLFEPVLVFAVLLGIIILLLPQTLETGELFSNLIRVGSLVFVAPIAYFFGREFKAREQKSSKNL